MIIVNFSRLTIPRIAWLDAVVLAAILIASNLWIAPKDPGWLGLSPSPYFLLPVLIGGRFGFLPGISAGILAGLIIGIGQYWLKKVDPASLLTSERYIYFSLILIGGICGEMQHFFYGRLK